VIKSRGRAAAFVAVVATLAVGLAACGSSSTSSTTGAGQQVSGTLNGSGATFPKAFYEESIQGFRDAAPDVKVTYAGGGSGQGQQELADQVTTWAGSDGIVKQEDLGKFKGGTFLYFPTVAAPITVSYNLASVQGLKLSPKTVADIFQGKITTWNDAAITADNSGVSLPDTAIKVVRRSDGSGTTENFTKYLSAAASNWTLGTGKEVQWPASTVGEKGNDGVAAGVKRDQGAIGYVDFSDAKAAGLEMAAIQNADGKFVEPSLDGASAALAGAKVNPDLTYNPLNAAGADSYPITAPTWVLVYQNQKDAQTASALRAWLTYLLTDAQNMAADIDFAKLPANLQQQALAQVDKVQASQ